MLESLLLFVSVVILVYQRNLFLEQREFQNSRDFGDFPAILFRIHALGYLFFKKEKNNNFSFLGENRRGILLKFINDKKVSIF